MKKVIKGAIDDESWKHKHTIMFSYVPAACLALHILHRLKEEIMACSIKSIFLV